MQDPPRALELDGPASDAPDDEHSHAQDHAQDAEPPGTVAAIAVEGVVAAGSPNDPAEDGPRPLEDLDHGEDPPQADAPPPSALPRPRPLIDGPTVVLSALVTLGFLMFLLIEPTQRWIALFGAAIAALGTEGVLRSARRRPIDLGLDPTPQLFLPALFALALPVFIEHNARGLWVPLAGLAAGAGFGAIVTAEVHSVRAYEPRLANAKLVTSSAAYLAGFALYSLTYSFELELLPAIAAAALISGLLSVELLRDAAAEPLDTLGFAAVTALVVGEIRWSLQFVPLDGHLGGLALLLGFFFVSGVLHAHLTRQLERAVLAEYAAIVAAGVVLVVAARAADLA